MQLKQFYLLKLVAEKSATTFGDILDSWVFHTADNCVASWLLQRFDRHNPIKCSEIVYTQMLSFYFACKY